MCTPCAQLHGEFDELRALFARRSREIVDSHHALHEERRVASTLDLADPPSQPLADLLRDLARAVYEPSADERAIAVRHPCIAWLVALPPRERAWHAHPDRLATLLDLYPAVSDDQWRLLLRGARR